MAASDEDVDATIRLSAFNRVRRLAEIYTHLTAVELSPGFDFNGARIPLINTQRGIFKPRQMRYLLSIKTVHPRPGGKIWYDDRVTCTVKFSRAKKRLNTLLWAQIRMRLTIGGFEKHLSDRY